VLEILVLAVALAMDATAVAIARGLATGARVAEAFLLGAIFGAAHAGMTALGWWLGRTAARWIDTWDHWLAFALLGLLGVKMIHAWWRGVGSVPAVPLGVRMVLALALAVSIDAVAAGVTLPQLDAREELAIAVIAAVVTLLSTVGGLLGGLLGERMGRRLELVGGLALIGIGVKIVVEHML
jgi:putative Mn2+ efflux pump MntP